MYTHHLDNMAQNLVEKGIITAENKQSAVNAMRKTWKDKIALSWDIEDVHRTAHNMGETVTDAQAREVLGELLDKHDANYGVDWTAIELQISIILS